MKYLIFTNIYRHNLNKSTYAMSNRFKVFYASSKEEVNTIVADITRSGFTVTKITTSLGTLVSL